MKQHKWLWDWIPLLLPVVSIYCLVKVATSPSQAVGWFWVCMITAIPFALITFIRMCPAPDEFGESESIRSRIWEQIMDIDESNRWLDKQQETKETNIWPTDWY